MEEYWLSCKKFTVWVAVENGIIKHQPFDNLKRWAGKKGELQIQFLNSAGG